jgi:hypothetical protein
MEPEVDRRKAFRSLFTWRTVTVSLRPAAFDGTDVLRPTVETQME